MYEISGAVKTAAVAAAPTPLIKNIIVFHCFTQWIKIFAHAGVVASKRSSVSFSATAEIFSIIKTGYTNSATFSSSCQSLIITIVLKYDDFMKF